jgi:hypothetical protein
MRPGNATAKALRAGYQRFAQRCRPFPAGSRLMMAMYTHLRAAERRREPAHPSREHWLTHKATGTVFNEPDNHRNSASTYNFNDPMHEEHLNCQHFDSLPRATVITEPLRINHITT